MRPFSCCTALLVVLLPGLVRAGDFVPPEVLPGGIAHPSLHTAFLGTPDNGIAAVDLATGKVLWQTAEAQRPLFVRDGHFYAVAAVNKKRPLRYFGYTWYKPPPGQHGFRMLFRSLL